ncbi:unnamed protein product [Paramecium pentaurelia]|uniref:Palmitoyltransferase n=1 Tax=Paramecium pentaurelia TaxID=43138 RepID=A0A8S1YJG1_9CILI|nr:unnamed protein product [Paramecium pentaurelia]
MKQLDAFYQDDSNQIQQEETTGVLEQENDQSFKPHYGNNCMVFESLRDYFYNSWNLFYQLYNSPQISYIWYSLGSIMNGLMLEVCFLRVFLKNPGVKFKLNYVAKSEKSCQLCTLIKEQGTYHCSKCDICVRGYDHHCPWVGKCIGEANIIEFQMFLLSLLFFFTCNLILVMI